MSFRTRKAVQFSPGQLLLQRATAVSEPASNQTNGIRFVPLVTLKCSGVRLYPLTTRNVKVSLWNPAGTLVTSATASATGGQWNTILFAAVQTIAPASSGSNLWAVSAWITDQSSARAVAVVRNVDTNMTNAPTLSTNTAGQSPFVYFNDYGVAWAAGDANPSNSAGTERYLVEPVFLGL